MNLNKNNYSAPHNSFKHSHGTYSFFKNLDYRCTPRFLSQGYLCFKMCFLGVVFYRESHSQKKQKYWRITKEKIIFFYFLPLHNLHFSYNHI